MMMMDSVNTKCTSVTVTWALLGLALTSVSLASGHWTQAASSQPLSSLSYLSETHNQSTGQLHKYSVQEIISHTLIGRESCEKCGTSTETCIIKTFLSFLNVLCLTN